MRFDRLAWPLLTCLCAAALVAGCGRSAPEPEPPRAVRTQVVGAGAAAQPWTLAGDVRAETDAPLAFRVGGKLLSRPVLLGQAVRAGQTLAQLDPADVQLGAAAAQAQLAAAQSQFTLAQAEHRRSAELHAQGFIGAAQMQRVDNARDAARAQLKQAQAQATLQGNQAAYSTLVAPFAGVVTAVLAEPGQVVGAGTPVLRLAANGPREVVVAVPEGLRAAAQALLGKAGAVQVQAWGDTAWQRATLRELAASADPVSRSYTAKARVLEGDLVLGQTATLRLPRPHADQAPALTLPLAAVFERQGRSWVWQLDPKTMTVRAVEVRLALPQGERAVIASGLAPGAEVVVAGTHVLTDGQRVQRWVAPGAGMPRPAASAAVPTASR